MLSSRKKTLRYSALLLLALGAVSFESQANETDIEINISDESISVAAGNRKLSEVLVLLGDEADIIVTGAEDIDVMFDGEIAGNDIEEVLRLLGVSSILVWDNSSSNRKITEMILLSASEEDSQFLPSGGTELSATANGEAASQQSALESSTAAQVVSTSAKPEAAIAPIVDVTNSDDSEDANTPPGFGFSIDPASGTINPQQ